METEQDRQRNLEHNQRLMMLQQRQRFEQRRMQYANRSRYIPQQQPNRMPQYNQNTNVRSNEGIAGVAFTRSDIGSLRNRPNIASGLQMPRIQLQSNERSTLQRAFDTASAVGESKSGGMSLRLGNNSNGRSALQNAIDKTQNAGLPKLNFRNEKNQKRYNKFSVWN